MYVAWWTLRRSGLSDVRGCWLTFFLQNMMAHIRYATQGSVALENVHPFSRELWGIQWTFCHNGDCPRFSCSQLPHLGGERSQRCVYHPIGDTDSEAVFCAILNALYAHFPDGLPTLPCLHEFLESLAHEIVDGNDSIFNFLLGCGQYTLFAYSWPGARPGSKVWNGLHYIVREPPFCTAKLLDVDYSINFAEHTNSNDRVAVIATKPLTCEPGWKEMQRGELIMFDKGMPHRTKEACEVAEREGRGLSSKCFVSKCNQSPRLTPPRVAPSTPPPLALPSATLGSTLLPPPATESLEQSLQQVAI